MNEKPKIDDLINNPTFCSMAWNHQFLDPTGRVKPCCRFQEKYRPPENNVNDNTLKNVFFGKWMSEVREKMLNGQPVDGCRRCYEEQNSGKKSLRQRYNDNGLLPIRDLVDIERPNIRWIELAISNNCNLACRMCDSRYSWKWFDEENAHWGKTANTKKVSKIDVEQIFPFLNDLVHIKFTGGEPLITPDHWRIIKKLVAERDCSNVFLNYSTNCTIFPKEDWVALWDHFKVVEFALSFDSVDTNESEYIRWPAKQENVIKTTKAFLELSQSKQFRSILRTTVSLLNIWSLPETITWWLENSPNQTPIINPTHLTYPEILSITVLPGHLKDKVKTKFEQFIQAGTPVTVEKCLRQFIKHMYSADNSDKLPELKSYIDKTDSYRGQNFYSSYPHFDTIFGSSSDVSRRI